MIRRSHMLPSVRSRAAVRRFFLAMALVTRCRAREHGPPLAAPPIMARNDSVAGGSSPIRWGRRLHDASDFTCVDISSTISSGAKFAGSTLVELEAFNVAPLTPGNEWSHSAPD